MAILDDKIKEINELVYPTLRYAQRLKLNLLLDEMKTIADSRLPAPVKKERCYNCWSNSQPLILVTEETEKGQTKEMWCKNCISFKVNENNTIHHWHYKKERYEKKNNR